MSKNKKKEKPPNTILIVILSIAVIFSILYHSSTFIDTFFKGSNSGNNSASSKGTNTGRDYIPLVSKGISENGIWGTRCYYSNGKVLEIESPRSVQIQGGWPPKCPAKY